MATLRDVVDREVLPIVRNYIQGWSSYPSMAGAMKDIPAAVIEQHQYVEVAFDMRHISPDKPCFVAWAIYCKTGLSQFWLLDLIVALRDIVFDSSNLR